MLKNQPKESDQTILAGSFCDNDSLRDSCRLSFQALGRCFLVS